MLPRFAGVVLRGAGSKKTVLYAPLSLQEVFGTKLTVNPQVGRHLLLGMSCLTCIRPSAGRDVLHTGLKLLGRVVHR